MEFEPHAFSAKYHDHSPYSVAEYLIWGTDKTPANSNLNLP